jgi:hypothetical protein
MKNLILKILITILAIQALFLASPSTVRAQEDTCLHPTFVTIDVRPGDDQNKVNLDSQGVLPVAVLSSTDFDASQFMPEMAHMSDASTAIGCEGAEATRWTYMDVNGDGLIDLLFFFRIQEINLTPESMQVVLMAHGMYNATPVHIHGTASVLVKA